MLSSIMDAIRTPTAANSRIILNCSMQFNSLRIEDPKKGMSLFVCLFLLQP